MTRRVRDGGEFCWISIMTSDLTASMRFFEQVLGWAFAPRPPIGHSILVDQGVVGALFDLNDPGCPPGLPPTIAVMVRVADADAGAEQVRALGGQVTSVLTLGDRGRMAVCHDPTGAAFHLLEPAAQPMMDVTPTTPGAPSWFETLTPNPDQATAFYTKLLGWTAEAREVGPGISYTTFHRAGVPVAGLMRVPQPEIPAHWGTYFTVSDADEAAARATEAGGTVFVPPTDIPAIGRFCGILSPQGVRFSAVAYLPGVRR